ncbi:MAG: dipeptidase [Candidatus Woesearchaeota archaeon]
MKVTEEAYKLHHSSFVADLHADTLLWDHLFGYDMLKRHDSKLPYSPLFNHIDAPRMLDGGVSLQAFAICTNYWLGKKKSAQKKAIRLDEIVKNSPVLEWALSGTKAEEVHKSGVMGVFLAMEGIHPLEGKIENLEWFHKKGLRYASLTHFNNTEAAYASTLPWNKNKKITRFGKYLIGAMNDLKIMVDLAHINYQGFFDAINHSRDPVIVSHSVVGKGNHPRALNYKQIHAIAENNGVIGIMFSPLFLNNSLYGTVEDIVDHIDYVKKLAGIDYVALGSDFDGFIHLPKGLKDISDLPVLTQVMMDRNYTEEEIQKVLGLNFLRVYKEVCG